eukprot:SAG31_NODE_12881_length_909_cov_1.438272_2_plen_159_part_00
MGTDTIPWPYERVKELVRSEMSAELLLRQFNYAFHNLSRVRLNAAELQVLGLGHKFMLVSFGPPRKVLDGVIHQFARRLYIRDFFSQRQSRDRAQPPDTRLRVWKPHWHLLQSDEYVPSPWIQDIIDALALSNKTLPVPCSTNFRLRPIMSFVIFVAM